MKGRWRELRLRLYRVVRSCVMAEIFRAGAFVFMGLTVMAAGVAVVFLV